MRRRLWTERFVSCIYFFRMMFIQVLYQISQVPFMVILILQMKAARYMFIVFLQAGKAQANSSNHWVLLKVIRLLYAVFVPATKIPIKWEAHSSFLK